MPTKRTSMRQIREILRLRYTANLSLRQIRASLKISLGGAQKIINQAHSLGLDWEAVTALDDDPLAQLFYPKADTRTTAALQTPDWTEVHRELKRKGMTKQLLWEEYCQQYPNRCYSYSQYCFLYSDWRRKQKRSMRQTHKAGEKLFVDYAGQTVSIIQKKTGEVRSAQIFVSVLGASNYTYCEATWTQTLPDWLGSHARALTFLGGVPRLIVPDNLKSGVSKACRYDPDTHPAYAQLAAHYQTAILPARPYKPKDKSKAEVGVQIIERWILARLRHHSFFSLTELNQAIQTLLLWANHKPFKKSNGCRHQWFESIDKPALLPLPKHPYEYTDIKTVRVNIDYHIQYDNHLYSVPHHLVGEKLTLQAKAYLIEMLFHNKRVASHPRQYRPGITTLPEHMPTAHQKHQQWTGNRIRNWAQDIGDHARKWVHYQLTVKDHEEQAFRVCLGLLNLSRQYTHQRLNKACMIANQQKLYRLAQVKSILKSNQDQLIPDDHEQPTQSSLLPQHHENIRGPHSFY